MAGDILAQRFEADRAHLRTVAYRLLGSTSEADDAVQETWLRLNRADTSAVENLSGWLTTVVGRVCLDMLRSRKSRREEPLAPDPDDGGARNSADPEREAILAESVGLAMLAILQRLAPAERVAFVLHDVFGVSFEEIAEIVDRSSAAARQLASRGRRRVRGESDESRAADVARHREVVEAFFRASRGGDLGALLIVLDPNVVLRGDAVALRMGERTGWFTSPEIRGAAAVAEKFNGGIQAAQLATVDGLPGLIWATRGTTRAVFEFIIEDGRIIEIALVSDPAGLGQMTIEVED